MATTAFLKFCFCFGVHFCVTQALDNCLDQEDCPAGLSVQAAATQFLQTGITWENAHYKDLTGKRASIQTISPLFFLHVPKCGGTQFGASLLLLPGVCWNLTASDVEALTTRGLEPLKWSQDFEDMCHVQDMRRFGYYFGDHRGVGRTYNQYVKGHGITFLRQPEQRILSNYWMSIESLPVDIHGRIPRNELEYAYIEAGCMVKMLTRDGAGASVTGRNICRDPTPATDAETHLAVQRLKDFRFIGMVEQWTYSICLWHAMFGGACTAQEFGHANSNPEANSTSEYDTTVLQGFTDGHDGKLYQEGLRIFWKSLSDFQVTIESCMPCAQQAYVA